MGSEAILAFSDRGRYAGRLLVERFSRPTGEEAEMLSWEDNRWVRYRNTMAITEALLKQIVQAFRKEEHVGTRSLIELIGRGPQEPPDAWRWHSPAQKEFAEKATKDLMDLVQLWIDSGQSFEESAPLPRPQLRMIPDF